MKVIGFIGSGNMGSAIIHSIAKTEKYKILIYDLDTNLGAKVAKETNSTSVGLKQLLADSDIIFLAVKPQVLPSLYKDLKVQDKQWISIAAGLSLETLQKNLATTEIVRVMPNIAAEVAQSASALVASKDASEAFVKESIELIKSFGSVYQIEEKLFSSFTALSGSAIATVFAFLNGLALGGVKEGLTYNQALDITKETTLGAIKLLQNSKVHPEELISRVCSPKGTTIESINLLESSGFKGILIDSISAASNRAEELEEIGNKEN